MNKPTHILIYCTKIGSTVIYRFKLQGETKTTPDGYSHVKLIKIPPQYEKEFDEHPISDGYLNYTQSLTNPAHVITKSIYPKGTLGINKALQRAEFFKGFGSLLESITMQHMRDTFNATHVKTTNDPSDSRRAQLQKIGLPVNTLVPIDEWIEKHEKASKQRA